MNMKMLLHTQLGWSWYPSLLIGFSLWTVLYSQAIRRGRPTPLGRQIAFHTGTIVALLALTSPLDELGDRYLFSAHMVQHLLLIYVTAPLWLIGTPGWLVDRLVPRRMEGLVRWLTSPMIAFIIFIGVLWIWHLPYFYEAAQENEIIHAFEHLTFIGAALIGWWPVMGGETTRFPKPEQPLRMLYLFLLAIPCTTLAAILTLANKPLYPFYVSAPHPLGLDVLQDQRLGGLLMWLPTHMFLLMALGITFLRWFVKSERQTERELTRSLG
jgi:putative membrane protein